MICAGDGDGDSGTGGGEFAVAAGADLRTDSSFDTVDPALLPLPLFEVTEATSAGLFTTPPTAAA
jgi:hypothetical protein